MGMNLRYNPQLDSCINNLTMELILSGYVETGPEWQWHSVRASFNRLYVVVSGSAWVQCGNNRVTLEPGKAYLIPPGLRINAGCPQQLSKLYFHINLLKPDHYDLFQSLDRVCSAEIPQEWISILPQLQSSARILDALLLKHYLYRIIALLAEENHLLQEDIPVYSSYVNRCIQYIQQNLSAKLQVSELAQLCYITPRQLHNLFRKDLGITPGQYLDDQLILSAQRLLVQTAEDVRHISELLGFSDQFYFSRKFKKACGLTPLQYRKCNKT